MPMVPTARGEDMMEGLAVGSDSTVLVSITVPPTATLAKQVTGVGRCLQVRQNVGAHSEGLDGGHTPQVPSTLSPPAQRPQILHPSIANTGKATNTDNPTPPQYLS
jgi:hypothetical protein